LQQQQSQQTGIVPTSQQQSQACAEDLPKHQLQSLQQQQQQQQQQAHALQGPQDLHQQGHPLHDATNHMHPWAGPRDKAQSNSQSLLDGILAGEGPALHTHTTAVQVPSAYHTAATTVGVSSRQAAATAALSSKAEEQRAEVHKAEVHKDRGFPSQAGHKKATQALPLQLMLYQWGLPQKVVQVNLHVHISSPDCSQCCYASRHATIVSSLGRFVASSSYPFTESVRSMNTFVRHPCLFTESVSNLNVLQGISVDCNSKRRCATLSAALQAFEDILLQRYML